LMSIRGRTEIRLNITKAATAKRHRPVNLPGKERTNG
jgi:hypothetical protein